MLSERTEDVVPHAAQLYCWVTSLTFFFFFFFLFATCAGSFVCIQAHEVAIRSIMWSHNDLFMVSCDNAGFVKYWQSNMNAIKMFQAHKDPIRDSR